MQHTNGTLYVLYRLGVMQQVPKWVLQTLLTDSHLDDVVVCRLSAWLSWNCVPKSPLGVWVQITFGPKQDLCERRKAG